MKRMVLIGFMFFVFAPVMGYAQESSRGNINVLLGQRNLNKDDWKPVEEQPTFAVEFDFAKKSWPVNILIGFAGSKKDEDVLVTVGRRVASVNVEGSTGELYVGARKYFGTGSGFAPYLNGGVSFINAKVSADVGGFGVSADDSSSGAFLGAGAVFKAGSFNIGLDLRFLVGTDIEIGGFSASADYTQFALVLGYGW